MATAKGYNRFRGVARPAGVAKGRWLGDFAPLSGAERRLVAACAAGEVCRFNNGKRPEVADGAYTVRAGVIRFLVLGGDAGHPVHEKGVQLEGAWVSGPVDLDGARTEIELRLLRCRFDAAMFARGARLGSLYLNGSCVPALKADRMQVNGVVYLVDGFSADDEVRLIGARIGGDLACRGGRFKNRSGNALNCDRMHAAGSVFLHEGFVAGGEVRLLGVRIGGNLECSGGRFCERRGDALSCDGAVITGDVFFRDGFRAIGAVRLLGAQIGGDVDCAGGRFVHPSGRAISLDGAALAGALLLRKASVAGSIVLTGAKVGTLVDDDGAWAGIPQWHSRTQHNLNGFGYERFIGPTSGAARIAWLQTQMSDKTAKSKFAPQPWEQCIKVLREMGHPHEAVKVAIAKQELMRRIGKIGKPLRWRDWTTWFSPVQNGLHWLYGRLAGYGYRPQPLFALMVAVWLVCAGLDDKAARAGLFAPTAAEARAANGYRCGAPGTFVEPPPGAPARAASGAGHGRAVAVRRPKMAWTTPGCVPPETNAFQPLVYSLDLIVPVVHFDQRDAWRPITLAPDSNMAFWGAGLRWLMWGEIVFGWAASLVLVAVLGNLVKKD